MVMFFFPMNYICLYSSEDYGDYDSDDSISVGTEDGYDTESLCSNDSYESRFIDYESTD